MLWRSEHLRGYSISARDGVLGKVDDFLFDDRDWAARWLVVETDAWFGRRVLIPTSSLGRPAHERGELPVSLTRQQVKDSPAIDPVQPISRLVEAELYGHYGAEPYWLVPPAGTGERGLPFGWGAALNAAASGGRSDDEPRHVQLRSSHELSGYSVEAVDGTVGSVNEFLIDERSWAMRYLVVDTGDVTPGRKLLVSPRRIARVSWDDEEIQLSVAIAQLRDAPAFGTDAAVDPGLEAGPARTRIRNRFVGL